MTWSVTIATMSGITFAAVTVVGSWYIGAWAYAVSIPIFMALQLLALIVHDLEIEAAEHKAKYDTWCEAEQLLLEIAEEDNEL